VPPAGTAAPADAVTESVSDPGATDAVKDALTVTVAEPDVAPKMEVVPIDNNESVSAPDAGGVYVGDELVDCDADATAEPVLAPERDGLAVPDDLPDDRADAVYESDARSRCDGESDGEPVYDAPAESVACGVADDGADTVLVRVDVAVLDGDGVASRSRPCPSRPS
jgi:hypothetical protein